jgi:hypothetical protein
MRCRPSIVPPFAGLLAAFATACGGDARSPSEHEAPMERAVAAATASAPSETSPAPAPPAPRMPAPYRGRLGAAVALNATCVSCHEREAAEWRGSRHRQAYTNRAFQEALRIEPIAFCRGCHGPESDPAKPPPPAVADLGVGCVTCHVVEAGTVLAAASPATGEPPAGATRSAAPHAILRSPDLGGTAGCAGCHEFRFPAARGDDDADFMQTTAREHERSRSAGAACAACHMPEVSGHRDHAFAGTRQAAWLADRLHATAERVDGRRVRITLAQPSPGHAFPTGDLFRRLEVGCELRDARGALVSRDVKYLARRFEIVPGRPGRQLVADDRVFDEPKVVDLALDPSPGPSAGVVAWWVTYQRVATVGAGTDPKNARIESEVRLHSGSIPWDER